MWATEEGLTQVQLAELLDVSQQAITAYERAARVDFDLPLLAHTPGVSVEDLIGSPAKRGTAGKRGPAPKIQQQLEPVSRLPKAKQRVISEVLDSLLAQNSRYAQTITTATSPPSGGLVRIRTANYLRRSYGF